MSNISLLLCLIHRQAMRACTWEEDLLSGQKDGYAQGQPWSCEESILAPAEN